MLTPGHPSLVDIGYDDDEPNDVVLIDSAGHGIEVTLAPDQAVRLVWAVMSDAPLALT